MNQGFLFFFNSIMLGVGLAMDAFTVSAANALTEPDMRRSKRLLIPGIFAFFQALMPLTGWVCIHTVVSHFTGFERFIPWISFGLLALIGGNMIREGLVCRCTDAPCRALTPSLLIVQAVATSIDALSVGFTIADYAFSEALFSALIIAAVTFVICSFGVFLGTKLGGHLADKAQIVGGGILVCIALELLVTGLM